MDFSTEKIDGVVVETIHLRRVTYKEAEQFRRILVNEIVEGNLKIIVDLHICEYMDSTFLGVLTSILKMCIQLGGEIKLAAPVSETQILLELTGAVRVFDVYKTKEEAMDSFNKQPDKSNS